MRGLRDAVELLVAKKTHPSRLLVNALAEAGLGWSPDMGSDDPLYRRIESIVRRILDDFSDNLALFDELREDLEKFLEEEEKAAEANIGSSADQINQRDRVQIAVHGADALVMQRKDPADDLHRRKTVVGCLLIEMGTMGTPEIFSSQHPAQRMRGRAM